MPKPTVKTESYRESLLESLRDPDEAAQYLNACLEDEDARVFLLAFATLPTRAAASEPYRAMPT